MRVRSTCCCVRVGVGVAVAESRDVATVIWGARGPTAWIGVSTSHELVAFLTLGCATFYAG